MAKLDLTGKRFGRLVVLQEHPEQYRSPQGKATRRWVCQCDCGTETIVLQNQLTSKRTQSCGCVQREVARSKKGTGNIKLCIICGKEFFASPSLNKVTCSPECRSKRAARASAERIREPWTDEARERRKNDPVIIEKMKEIQSIGTDKALQNPKNQRGPQNRESKRWIIYTPDREQIVVTNLKHWARENYDLFEPGSDNIEETATRICNGFQAIAQSLKGNRGAGLKQGSVAMYKGWFMLSLPEEIKDK